MADEDLPLDNILPFPSPDVVEEPPRQRSRRKRSLKVDKAEVVRTVLEDLRRDLGERQDWMNRRMERYAKLRGWLPEREDDTSNAWLPLMLMASLRVKSALHNAVLGIRPTMQAKAYQRRNADKEARIDQLLDWQVYTEAHGEEAFDAYTSNFVDDGTAFAFVPWIHQRETIHDVRVTEPLDPAADLIVQMLDRLRVVVPRLENATLPSDNDSGWSWDVSFFDERDERQDGRVEFYEREEDQRIEAHIEWLAVTHDGPSIQVEDLEDIVAPRRSANLQPPGAANPHGALYVARLGRTTLDDVYRRWKDGTYDLMDADDWEKIKSSRPGEDLGAQEDQRREQQDQEEGLERGFGTPDDPHRQIVERYGRWDVNDDGLEEEVIFWVLRDAEVLVRARYLTEIYPGLPPRRPFAESRFIGVPNRLYGIGLPETLEAIQVLSEIMFNQNIDWGTLRNAPFGFYRASSGLKQEVIRYEPGALYPLDDPQRDVYFPQLQGTNNAWSFQMLQALQQMAERLTTISDVQLGRIPTGKASALRTASATMALLGQADIRSEQVLRRLFRGLAQIYQLIHRLNQRYLTHTKEIRLVGLPEPGADAYGEISPEDIQADVDFDFRATMLNTNRQQLAETLQQTMMVLLSPLAIQFKLITPEGAYKLLHDYLKAQDLDGDRYLYRAPNIASRPKIFAAEALSQLIIGERVEGLPIEAAQEHLQKVLAFQQSPNFALLDTPEKLQAYQAYVQQLVGLVQEEQAQQQRLMAAQQTQGLLQGNGRQAGPVTAGQPPPAPMMEENYGNAPTER